MYSQIFHHQEPINLMRTGQLSEILLIIYIAFLTIALIKPVGLYNLLGLRKLRNSLLLYEGFFILAVLAFVKLEFLNVIYVPFVILLACIWATGDSALNLKKNLRNDGPIPSWVNCLHKVWTRRFKRIIYIGIIIVVALYPIIYSQLYKQEFNFRVYRNSLLTRGLFFGLCATTLELLMVILAEKKYGKPFYNTVKRDSS